jgi:hypothetical protein
MTSKINDHTKYIRTFLQALCLYFHNDEWNFGIIIPFQIALIKDNRNYN